MYAGCEADALSLPRSPFAVGRVCSEVSDYLKMLCLCFWIFVCFLFVYFVFEFSKLGLPVYGCAAFGFSGLVTTLSLCTSFTPSTHD